MFFPQIQITSFPKLFFIKENYLSEYCLKKEGREISIQSGRNICFICALMGSVQRFCLKTLSNIICVPSFFQQKTPQNLISLFIVITSTQPLCHVSGAPTVIAPWEYRGGGRFLTSAAAPWKHWHPGEGREKVQKKEPSEEAKTATVQRPLGSPRRKVANGWGGRTVCHASQTFNLDWLIQYTRLLQGLDTCWVQELTFSLTLSVGETFTQGCLCFQWRNSFFCLVRFVEN